MQYLSKAYNYYSGINPATLSGAIDIIVVRSHDEHGNEILQSSPFHVRFGKLQVLRAGEKRVSLHLPNNLPAPHVAPFSMKVGETGEAFFVFETEEDVPADLLTSPVVMAADAEELPIEKPEPIPADGGKTLTHTPFGATETKVDHEGHEEHLAEVEPLDLDALPPGNGSALDDTPGTPTQGTSKLPASGGRRSSTGSLRTPTDGRRASISSTSTRSTSFSSQHSNYEQPPNPLEAKPGEVHGLPARNYRLSMVHSDYADAELPKIAPGSADAPDVRYGKDIVLDMEGFHRPGAKDGERSSPTKAGDKGSLTPTAKASYGEAEKEPQTPTAKSGVEKADKEKTPKAETDKDKGEKNDEPKDKDPVENFVNDLMASTSRPRSSKPDAELVKAMDSLALDPPSRPVSPTLAAESNLDRSVRATSEPPAEFSRPSSPSGEPLDSSQMDLAWDWGGVRDGDDVRKMPQHSNSLPPGVDGLGLAAPPRATLNQDPDDPYGFILELEGRTHHFEISLCGREDYAPDGKASLDEVDEFEQERVTFQKFMDDPTIVDELALVVHYGDLYLSWTTGYQVLFALTIYRRSLGSAPSTKKQANAAANRSSGYWSRWWRRSEAAPAELSTAPVLARTQSAMAAPSKDKLDKETRPAATVPASEVPSPAASPSGTPQPQPADAEPAAEQKHYAKTLRLTSDQLKELHLKPGPNTVQFSVTSSYSGNAVVGARIFLWDENDQVVISDIDGTITKSDALGHFYAAIGRDWTHPGIANLYTDICNNGYKIIYLTARAIGQADTTRDYLKTIVQGEYRMPEGPVIMSPDRLMASLHREVILRKPELFKMACLRDIQRLFGARAKDAFFAGFGNRITDAMSYRSVGIPTGKIYTIDSLGVIKTELLQSSHKGSYVGLNDLVNEVFPPVKTKVQPEYTDFNYWHNPIPEFDLPDLSPPSPALSARSDNSRMSTLGMIVSLGRRGSSRAHSPEPASGPSSRPSSPLVGPAIVPEPASDDEDWTSASQRASRPSSMPGSFEGDGPAFPDSWLRDRGHKRTSTDPDEMDHDDEHGGQYDQYGNGHDHDGADDVDYDDDDIFDDDILATGEMARVPF